MLRKTLVLVMAVLALVAPVVAAAPPVYSKYDLNFDGNVDEEDVTLVEAVWATRGPYSGVRTPEVTGIDDQGWPYRIVNIRDFSVYASAARNGQYRQELDWYPDGRIEAEDGPDIDVMRTAFGSQNPDVNGDGWVDEIDVNLVRQAAGLPPLPAPAAHFWVIWDVLGEARLGYFGGDCVFNAVSEPVKFAPTADRPGLFGVDFIVGKTANLAVAVYAYGVSYPLGYSRYPGEWPH